MKFQFVISFFAFVLLTGVTTSCKNLKSGSKENLKLTIAIPAEGNSWVVGNSVENPNIVQKGGIKNWNSKETVIRTFFKTEKTGKLDVGILTKVVFGAAEIKISLGDKTEIVKIDNSGKDTVFVGSFKIKKPGYHFVDIQGVEKTGDLFPEIESFLIGGEATLGKVYFVKDDFYWGRRGPSVHLNFQVPGKAGDVLFFYNEITVPENNDVVGSYFMADGFKQGYFGMQVNSPTERHILFSVWSPFKTNNPGDIPEDERIQLLKKGDGVHTKDFGNEGSGGQSYLIFPWKAGTTYKFLLKGKPTGNGETDFTAWFFAPVVNDWKLIASFRRPKTDTYLTHLYSFLENFIPKQGNITRQGNYSNQWVYNTNNQWVELTKIKFTADATARKQSRMDYAGGVENGLFYLKNGGFFSETTAIDSYFERAGKTNPPVINFKELP
ncbi:MAG: DUF3472 domain-containing protein [Prolixibacteraceae bacterium]|nr:DUF3472 domain-containing protein [Prolixibacteraceae bacterium]